MRLSISLVQLLTEIQGEKYKMGIRTFSGKCADIEYHGQAGITQYCLDAIVRLIHFGDRIQKAMLLTHEGRHCFLLTVNYGEIIAIKCGFGSGYTGEGAHGLSTALQLLERHGAEIKEYEVAERVIQCIDGSCLQANDLEYIDQSRPIRPTKWRDYVYEIDGPIGYSNEKLQAQFPLVLPLSLIDTRLIDLALDFEQHTDHVMFTAYKRLEDTVRNKADLLGESGQKLFSKAFMAESSRLHWHDIDTAEQSGRASLFIGAYMAFRNPRAHQESTPGLRQAVHEFLLINMLFTLEAESVVRSIPLNTEI